MSHVCLKPEQRSSMEAMTGTMFSCGYLLATVRDCVSRLYILFLMDFKRGLLLILYKANKLDYCLDKPSVKRRTQRSLDE